MARGGSRQDIDRELAELPPELRWSEWMRRIEAVLFASGRAVAREDLARVVGQGVSIDLVIADLSVALAERPYEIVRSGNGWVLRTRKSYAEVIRAAADTGDQSLDLGEHDIAVLAAIALHQPVTRDGLKDIFGKEIGRARLGRLAELGLIATGPRAPRPGAPYSYVTTDRFLEAFDLGSLADLPDLEQLADSGLAPPPGSGAGTDGTGSAARSRDLSGPGAASGD